MPTVKSYTMSEPNDLILPHGESMKTVDMDVLKNRIREEAHSKLSELLDYSLRAHGHTLLFANGTPDPTGRFNVRQMQCFTITLEMRCDEDAALN